MYKAERGKISETQLFHILLAVRLYSLLLDVKSMADFALLFSLSALLLFAVSVVKGTLLRGRGCRLFFGLVCVALTVQTVISYLHFSNTAVHPEFSTVLLVALIAVSVIYAAFLRVEALARFSALCVAVISVAVITAFLTNLNAFHPAYLDAVSFESEKRLYVYLKCLDLPVLYALLAPRVRGNPLTSYKRGLLTAYGVSFAVLLYMYAVMGNAVGKYAYPSFTLFQLSRVGSLSRLDIVYIGSMLLGLFLKCAVLLYSGLIGIIGDKFEKS